MKYDTQRQGKLSLLPDEEKIITTIVIRPLDDRTYCVLGSLIWGFGENCTIVHGIKSEPENVWSNVLY